MITYEFKSSFDRTIKTLPTAKRQEVKSLAKHLIKLLSEEQRLSKGMGLTRLRGNYWDKKSDVVFMLVGSHDQVKNFLKNVK